MSLFCAAICKIVSTKESEMMDISETDLTKNIGKAHEILKQFRPNYYLSAIQEQPKLSKEEQIENMDEFIALKKKAPASSSCSTPVERLAALAPKIVSTILEVLDGMPGTLAEKEALFVVYIEQTKEVEAIETGLLNQAYTHFLKEYEDKILAGSIRSSEGLMDL